MLFDSFEAYDVQETRRISREEGRIEGKAAKKTGMKMIPFSFLFFYLPR